MIGPTARGLQPAARHCVPHATHADRSRLHENGHGTGGGGGGGSGGGGGGGRPGRGGGGGTGTGHKASADDELVSEVVELPESTARSLPGSLRTPRINRLLQVAAAGYATV